MPIPHLRNTATNVTASGESELLTEIVVTLTRAEKETIRDPESLAQVAADIAWALVTLRRCADSAELPVGKLEFANLRRVIKRLDRDLIPYLLAIRDASLSLYSSKGGSRVDLASEMRVPLPRVLELLGSVKYTRQGLEEVIRRNPPSHS
ncbi:hypothetical protein ABZV60_36135 [Streptomyces sp. NPDC004787]|uniref:hypothetical protein n=1 Tax=Streptomyces sp. NPDC004787 TaxID=3154291 RepID=UPI0033BA95BA